jgi:hypothetical protein
MRFSCLNFAEAITMSSQKSKVKKSRSHRRKGVAAARAVRVAISPDLAVQVPVPKSTTDVITEKTYVTTEPEVEIRKPATLAQALTEPAVAVVKPKSRVRKEVVARTRRAA